MAKRRLDAALGCILFLAVSWIAANVLLAMNDRFGAGKVDGVHLDADQHGVLGRALAKVVGTMSLETV
jgi:hypothetical protein